MDKYIGLFFVTLLDMEYDKYSFGRAVSKKLIDETKIKLPPTKDGEIDFEWIEDFIREKEKNTLLMFMKKYSTNKKDI